MGKLDLTYVLPYLSGQVGRNHGLARLGLKMVKIQKFLLPQVFPTLWTTDG